MPGPARHRQLEAIQKACSDGLLTEAEIDRRVVSVLKFVKDVGKFENPGKEGPEQAIDNPVHRSLIREAGADGIVLLKNDNAILPLKKNQLKAIAVLGQAKACLAHGGGSAGLNAHYKVTPYEALKRVLGDDVKIQYAKGMCSETLPKR
jgi:beta-glucosidase